MTLVKLHFDTLNQHTDPANGGAIQSVNSGATGNKQKWETE